MKRILVTACLLFLLGMLGKIAASTIEWSPSGPIPRELHSAVLDTVTNKTIVFGGLPSDTSSSKNLNDVWHLMNTGSTNLSWARVAITGSAMPAGRFGHSAGYDPTSNEMIIFGGAKGRSTPCLNDVWDLSNANGTGSLLPGWTQLSPSGTAPAARTTQGGVYDPGSNTLMIFGGQDCGSTTFSDAWYLWNANGVGGTPTWGQLLTSSGPGPRQGIGQSVVYNATTNQLILFGGTNGSGTYFNDVWTLGNANGYPTGSTAPWTQVSTSGTPPAARAGASVIYDSANNILTLFGGGNASGNFGDTWVLSNANGQGGTSTWTQIASRSLDFPAARINHTAVWNSSTDKMTIFGGNLGSIGSVIVRTSDVFTLSNANGQ